ncbi:Cytochrome c [Lignipirellula cremea]|uniref:Cytochrome c n=2 Tax=Lignipirellula cremea TaxID=2528010 RepID=A0A518DUH7_9BACT|nr:Cytochrome c [Lignipirellula cremea]
MKLFRTFCFCLIACLATHVVPCGVTPAVEPTFPEPPSPESTGSPDPEAAERGYRFLTEKKYLTPDFNDSDLAEVWKVWPEPLRTAAEKASAAERRRLAFARYGLTLRPDDDSGKPLQYVVDDRGDWTMNCFACHGGSLLGQPTPGLPNSNFALQTLTEEMRLSKAMRQQKLSRMDVGSLFMPLGESRGVTNAVMFGVILLAYRDAELNLLDAPLPKLVHHDMDPPPWWHFQKKKRLYIDGFAATGHRPLMQFMLIKQNGPEKFRQWEDDYRDVEAWLQTVQPPEYPLAVDQELAAQGRQVFTQNCAQCHGTYGAKETYPEKIIPLEEVGTDPVRLQALTPKHRELYGASWFSDLGKKPVIADPGGYVAPPLDGVWASAPYFHNGSVPTLWHVLHPDSRPAVWRRQTDAPFDQQRIGLAVDTFDKLPEGIKNGIERREFYSTQDRGKSAAGHRFPDELTEPQKQALLEYLKTL